MKTERSIKLSDSATVDDVLLLMWRNGIEIAGYHHDGCGSPEITVRGWGDDVRDFTDDLRGQKLLANNSEEWLYWGETA